MTQMIQRVALGAVGACLVLVGCAAQVDVGGAEAGLVTVRKADFEGRLLYIDDAVSVRPMTEEELGDTRFATPVEVRFYSDVAVAWYAPTGVAETGDPRNAIRMWRIVQHVATSSDDVAPGDGSPTTTTPRLPPSAFGSADGFDVVSDTGASPSVSVSFGRYLPLARLDWLRVLEELVEAKPGFHPGC